MLKLNCVYLNCCSRSSPGKFKNNNICIFDICVVYKIGRTVVADADLLLSKAARNNNVCIFDIVCFIKFEELLLQMQTCY